MSTNPPNFPRITPPPITGGDNFMSDFLLEMVSETIAPAIQLPFALGAGAANRVSEAPFGLPGQIGQGISEVTGIPTIVSMLKGMGLAIKDQYTNTVPEELKRAMIDNPGLPPGMAVATDPKAMTSLIPLIGPHIADPKATPGQTTARVASTILPFFKPGLSRGLKAVKEIGRAHV